MDNPIDQLDWSYLKSFVAVAETGSLTAAAQRLGQSQPTIGRHIKAAEDMFGAALFKRELRGLSLTEFGLSVLEPAKQMAEQAARLQNIATGLDQGISGTVRITASMVMSHYVLPEIIANIRRSEPHIEIELVPSDATENLLFREADIAIRMYRPKQLDIVAQHIADQEMALYASNELINRYGQPSTMDELSKLPFVGFDKSDTLIKLMRDLGWPIDRHFFGVRCDDQAAHWNLVRSGCGVGGMQTSVGDHDDRVCRITYQPPLPKLPIWIAATDALRRNLRIRRVWDMLVDGLQAAARS
ncbi:LysR family transcriptional regulator [Marivivens niveibacter]|uniref:LysR family transcriptional regulator n=1 Tax=Marivivens niveibacter TaxID=1930667 RepID=A0A251WWQ1_9RHOB|nr:LysR family transcriptional regulator [Marivivens niveibacter]OUD08558.1 LysR family transcriptional regulator [Marivivens niveibacter]